VARIKLGMAFAGGGVRGASHLGVAQALHEQKIYPEVYAGTSAGAIVASLLAYGYEPELALEAFTNASEKLVDIAYLHILKGTLTTSNIEGFVAGDKLEETLESLFNGGWMTDVEKPLGIVASDINKGRQVIFTNRFQGFDFERINDSDFSLMYPNDWIDPCQVLDYKLSDVVRASCGIPPIFLPKNLAGMKLVDGGITNNLPSDVAWALGADKVISLDLGYAGEVETDGFVDIAHMSINLLMKRVVDGNRDDFGKYLNPRIYDVTALDVSKINECFERGYRYGRNQLPSIIQMLEEDLM
jgi:NTE family protein